VEARTYCAVNLQRIRLYFELVRAEASAWVVMSGEVVGEGARSQLGWRANGARGTALLAREARGRGTVGALTAMEYLR